MCKMVRPSKLKASKGMFVFLYEHGKWKYRC